MKSAILFLTCCTLLLSSLPSTHATPINGAALAKRDVPISNCTTVDRGFLATDGGSGRGSFVLTPSGALAYDNSASSPCLAVEFQTCTPNFGGWKNDGSQATSAGHLYFPTTKNCLSVQEPGNEPFMATAAQCQYSDDSIQFLYNFVKKGDKYYWTGSTNESGTMVHFQDTCPTGFFGYAGNTDGTPTTFGPGGKLGGLTCEGAPGTFGFRIVQK